ncbi:hypothetical protein FJN17_07460 [Bradyrhizobium symbiodeficiens]|uniref:Uncharacterized protein n=1 Tax=Bradyrhizobium symbiodeficiens TaxID=1404367 RepID=A0ABZ2F231_9BRAD|nr:hypothetical protein [Bradyrhizobium symbiodeficiens]
MSATNCRSLKRFCPFGPHRIRLRLPAEPHRAVAFGPWHLADRIASPLADTVAPQDAYTIRYRVL